MTSKSQLTIISYHYVRPIKNSLYPGIKGLELEEFKQQLDYLTNEYSIITAEQLISKSLGKEDLPNNSCYLTFDDGFKDHIEFVMPELLSRKLQGSFFPTANAIEKREILDVHAIHYILASITDSKKLFNNFNEICLKLGVSESDLNSSQKLTPNRFDNIEISHIKRMLQYVLPDDIRSKIISILFEKYVKKSLNEISDELYMSISDIKSLIKNGMYVGTHGCSHLHLEKQSKSFQERDIKLSLGFLERVGAPIENWIMCYPYGSYNQDTLDILKSYKCAVGLSDKTYLLSILDSVEPDNSDRLNNSKMLELNRLVPNDLPQ